MSSPTQDQHTSTARTVGIFLIVAAITIGAAHLADHPVAERVFYPDAASTDWGRLLRVVGYLPTWLLIGAALILIDRTRNLAHAGAFIRDPLTRGVMIAASAAATGLLAEALKLVVRRGRPTIEDGLSTGYAFRALADSPLSTSGLGMPSSHAAVGFGAMCMLCILHRPAWPVWMLLAIGCGATRVLARAHFVSDIVASAFLGAAVAWILWRLHVARCRREQRSVQP